MDRREFFLVSRVRECVRGYFSGYPQCTQYQIRKEGIFLGFACEGKLLGNPKTPGCHGCHQIWKEGILLGFLSEFFFSAGKIPKSCTKLVPLSSIWTVATDR